MHNCSACVGYFSPINSTIVEREAAFTRPHGITSRKTATLRVADNQVSHVKDV